MASSERWKEEKPSMQFADECSTRTYNIIIIILEYCRFHAATAGSIIWYCFTHFDTHIICKVFVYTRLIARTHTHLQTEAEHASIQTERERKREKKRHSFDAWTIVAAIAYPSTQRILSYESMHWRANGYILFIIIHTYMRKIHLEPVRWWSCSTRKSTHALQPGANLCVAIRENCVVRLNYKRCTAFENKAQFRKLQ